MTTTALPMRIPTDVIIEGTVTVGGLGVPAGTLKDADWSAVTSNRLSADRYVQRFPIPYQQNTSFDSEVVSDTRSCHAAHAGGTLEAIDVWVDVVPAGGNKAFTVDFQKSTGGAAFASMLNAAVTVNSSTSAKTVVAAVLAATPTYLTGDCFRWVITASGTTGTQGYGLNCVAWMREQPS